MTANACAILRLARGVGAIRVFSALMLLSATMWWFDGATMAFQGHAAETQRR